MKLHEVKEQFLEFAQLCEAEEFDEDAIKDTLESLDCEFEEKADGIACVIKQNTAEAKVIREEAKNLVSRALAKENANKRMLSYLLVCMKLVKKLRVETIRNKISIKQNPESVEVDNGFVLWAQTNDRDDFLKYIEPVPDKNAIKEYLKSGNLLSHAALKRTERLEIK